MLSSRSTRREPLTAAEKHALITQEVQLHKTPVAMMVSADGHKTFVPIDDISTLFEQKPNVSSFKNYANESSFKNNANESSFKNNANESSFTNYANESSFENSANESSFKNYANESSFKNNANERSFKNSASESSFKNSANESSFKTNSSATYKSKVYKPIESSDAKTETSEETISQVTPEPIKRKSRSERRKSTTTPIPLRPVFKRAKSVEYRHTHTQTDELFEYSGVTKRIGDRMYTREMRAEQSQEKALVVKQGNFGALGFQHIKRSLFSDIVLITILMFWTSLFLLPTAVIEFVFGYIKTLFSIFQKKPVEVSVYRKIWQYIIELF